MRQIRRTGTRAAGIASALLLVLAGMRGARAQDVPPLPVEIAPAHPHIRYIGRFDTRDAAGPRCSWSASTVELRFRGSALNVRLKEVGNDRYQVVIDGKPTAVLETREGTGVYRVAEALPRGEHTLRLVKRTEPSVGTTQFLGFQREQNGELLPDKPRPRRRIEVIGDSISCGFGNEGKDQNEHFSPATENAYLTYGAIAARALNADYLCVAWSGKKMWPDNTIPEIYDRTLPQDAQSRWDFSRYIPDAVVVNLATNDFGQGNPDRKGWTDAYLAFLARVRKAYPKAHIYCASGSMMSDNWPPETKALSTLKSYLNQIVEERNRAGDRRVHVIAFAPQEMKDGIGSDWHPSVRTHEIMALTLVQTLKRDLGWK